MSTIQYAQSAPGFTGASGDPIATLPVDKSQPTNNELQIVNTLFTKHKSTMESIAEEFKDLLIIGLLFVVISLPMTNEFIKKVLPITEKSPYILIAIKALAVMALYWLIKHFYLSRKSS